MAHQRKTEWQSDPRKTSKYLAALLARSIGLPLRESIMRCSSGEVNKYDPVAYPDRRPNSGYEIC